MDIVRHDADKIGEGGEESRRQNENEGKGGNRPPPDEIGESDGNECKGDGSEWKEVVDFHFFSKNWVVV